MNSSALKNAIGLKVDTRSPCKPAVFVYDVANSESDENSSEFES
jgi:hypothetical protein